MTKQRMWTWAMAVLLGGMVIGYCVDTYQRSERRAAQQQKIDELTARVNELKARVDSTKNTLEQKK